jgi:hypothetical protein
MARLPTPGGDAGDWGTILNEYLSISLDGDGHLKPGAVTSTALSNSLITSTHIQDAAITVAKIQAGTPASGDILTFNGTQLAWTTPANTSTPDATTTEKGKLALSNDLGGTADAPTVPGLATKQPLSNNLTTIAGLTPATNDILQYRAGAWANRTPAQVKTDLSITKSDVGLANVDNTSDANKPISSATQSALDAKANSADVTNKQPLNTNLTTIAGLTPATNDTLQYRSGAWTNRTPAQIKSDLSLTKEDVNLGNVDNTSDANKPISTATQTALNLKANGDEYVAKTTTEDTNPATPLISHTRNFAVDSGNQDIMQFYAGAGTPKLHGWINEWGGYRGTPYFRWDAVIRMVAHATQNANIIEYQNNARDTTLWGIDQNGYTNMNGVTMAPVLVLGAADPVPANTPAGTVILRTQ